MTLELVVLFGLVAAGLTATVRAVVQDRRPELLLEKPLSCDLCMSFWCSLAAVLVWSLHAPVEPVPALLAVFGAVGVSLLSVKAASRLSS